LLATLAAHAVEGSRRDLSPECDEAESSSVREYRGPLPFWSYFPEMCWRGRRIGSTKSKAPRRELTALYRYSLTGELYGDDEIRGFYEDDITNLEVEDRQAITVENWLGKTCSTVPSTNRRTRTRDDRDVGPPCID
jgi:hypothetical protein